MTVHKNSATHDHEININENIAHFLHIKGSSPAPKDFIKNIRKGLSFKSVIDVSKELEMSQQELSKTIGMNVRTLARRREQNKLEVDEGDRLYRLVHIYAFAVKVLKDKKFAIQWLNSPKAALDGEIPFHLVDTQAGTKEVENLLGRIEYGVYS